MHFRDNPYKAYAAAPSVLIRLVSKASYIIKARENRKCMNEEGGRNERKAARGPKREMGAGEKQAGRWLRELSTMCSPDLYSYHWPTFEFEKDYTLCSNTQGSRMQWGTHLRRSSFKLNSL